MLKLTYANYLKSQYNLEIIMIPAWQKIFKNNRIEKLGMRYFLYSVFMNMFNKCAGLTFLLLYLLQQYEDTYLPGS